MSRLLLQKYYTPQAVFEADIKGLVRPYPQYEEKLTKLDRSRKGWEFEKETEKMRRKKVRFISCEHPEFPRRLKEIPESPKGLFVRGNLPDDDSPSIALVGARKCSIYGRNVALWFGKSLAENGVQIISGMARGIDGYSHRGALQGEGRTFAVLAGGVDVCYPIENRDIFEKLEERGGILSESPPGIKPLRHLFPLRNRIISGLADSVLIIEAKEKSGSLITADLALEQGRDVYAVPGRLGDELSVGCHNLIRQGAGLAASPEILLEDLHFLPGITNKNKGKNKIALERSENLVYSCLGLQAKELGEISCETGLSSIEVLSILAKMELKGYAKEVCKNYYIVCAPHN